MHRKHRLDTGERNAIHTVVEKGPVEGRQQGSPAFGGMSIGSRDLAVPIRRPPAKAGDSGGIVPGGEGRERDFRSPSC